LRSVNQERNTAVAATLGTAIDTAASAARGHVDLILQLVLRGNGVVGGEAIPTGLLYHAQGGPIAILNVHLLVAAALGAPSRTGVGAVEVVKHRERSDCVDIGPHMGPQGHGRVPPAVGATAEANAAGRLLIEHGFVLPVDKESELTIGIAATTFLQTAFAGLNDLEFLSRIEDAAH